MKTETINNSILKYLNHLNSSNWIIEEAYKFEFANFIQSNLNIDNQTDQEILDILIQSQNIKYDKARGIQFIQKSGRKKLSQYIQLSDVQLFRQFRYSEFDTIDWANRSMSFTGLSAWLATIYPDKFYPVPIKGFNETINYLFETDLKTFPKTGANYITTCQDFLKKTEIELKKYPIKEIHLNIWNTFFKNNHTLNVKQKSNFEQVDWNWLTQDLHLFIHRNILNLYKYKKEIEGELENIEIKEDNEPVSIEGQSKLALHMRYERNSILIRKIKESAVKSNPMLNCEICGFSFFQKYGELGKGFIEAHHINPLYETKKTKTTKDDI